MSRKHFQALADELKREQHPWLFGDFDETGKPQHKKV